MEQIHPDDCARVLGAAEKARITGGESGLSIAFATKTARGAFSSPLPVQFAGRNGETEGLVVVNRDITERKRAEEMLAHSAFHDGLTNLANRTLLLDRLGRALATSRRHADFQVRCACSSTSTDSRFSMTAWDTPPEMLCSFRLPSA